LINLSPKPYRQKNNKNLLKKDKKSRKRFLLSKVTTSHNKCVIIASFTLHCVSKAKKKYTNHLKILSPEYEIWNKKGLLAYFD
jgi:hypothetical protein